MLIKQGMLSCIEAGKIILSLSGMLAFFAIAMMIIESVVKAAV